MSISPTADRKFSFTMSNADAEDLFQQLIAAQVQHLQSSMKWEIKGNQKMVDYNKALWEQNIRLAKIVMDGMSDVEEKL